MVQIKNVDGVEIEMSAEEIATLTPATGSVEKNKQDSDEAEKKATDKANANQKLKDLGLTDDEIKAIKS
tara:strand:+ start:345 stop:551 length:207 start_codon:yes stop_codon:yes gene_type:complete